MMIDSVGTEQPTVNDLEAAFEHERCDPNEVARFLLNLASYTLGGGRPFRDGDTVHGPSGIWQMQTRPEALMGPPRPIKRWLPKGSLGRPNALA
jgi:hypothetical protein